MSSTVGYLWGFFLLTLIMQLPFIICDFIYMNNGNCANDHVSGLLITLHDWLMIDGIARTVLCLVPLLTFIYSLFKDSRKLVYHPCVFLAFFSVAELAWILTGSVLYWGKLDPSKTCDAHLIGYMYAILILGYVSVICQVVMSIGQLKK